MGGNEALALFWGRTYESSELSRGKSSYPEAAMF